VLSLGRIVLPLGQRAGLSLCPGANVEDVAAVSSARPALANLPTRGLSARQRVVALTFGPRGSLKMTYEYRVFIVHDGEESSFSHYSSEKLWDGAVLRVSKPGAPFDGASVTVHRVVSHPTMDRGSPTAAGPTPAVDLGHAAF
jgi:hypothetical protein